jgi:signal transduction histidine kinase
VGHRFPIDQPLNLISGISGSRRAPTPFAALSPQRPGRTRLWWALCLASGAVSVLAGVFFGSHAGGDQVDRGVVEAAIVGVPVAVGLYLCQFAHDRRFGLLLIGAGLAWSLTALGASPDSLPYSIGRVSAWLIFPLLVYLMLAFPEGRLASGWTRALFGSVTGLIVVLYAGSALFVDAYPTHTPWAFCDADCPPNAFMVVDRQPAIIDAVVIPVREVLGVVLLAAVTWWLARRLRTVSPLQRRAIAPVVFMSLAWLVTLVAYLVTRRAAPDATAVDIVGRIWSLCIPGIAAAFLVGMVRRRVGLGELLYGFGVRLSRPRDVPELRATLASLLNDGDLDVLTPASAGTRWYDSQGRPTSLEAVAERGRAITAIPRAGPPDLVLAHDPALAREGEMLEAVTALIEAWLEFDRLTVGLAASRSELGESRERIARVADAERSRIERDLHDGAQQRLIMLRIKLSLAEDLLETDPGAAAQAVHELGTQIDLAVEELRALAHGVYPSLLNDRGLADALRGVVLDSPLAVHLEAMGVTRHPVEIETAVYFVCVEAVQNANKHAAGATGLWISLHEEDRLRVEILDDGPGFEVPRTARGGLRNMRDRVEAVGGELLVDTAPGRGTRIAFSVPSAGYGHEDEARDDGDVGAGRA